jgi:hypothetical protein
MFRVPEDKDGMDKVGGVEPARCTAYILIQLSGQACTGLLRGIVTVAGGARESKHLGSRSFRQPHWWER